MILEELLKIINKVEDLRSGHIQSEFSTPEEFFEKLVKNSEIDKIIYPVFKDVEFL